MSDQRLIRATALLFCLRFLAAFLIDLAPQETYYWNYAEHPALSYFDHPPMIAWVIGAGQFFLGKNALGVRLGGLLLTLLSTWLLYTLGRFWFNRRAGLWAALLFQLIPLYFVYGLLITPDVPLIFFWLLTLYLVSLAVREEKKWAWYLAGAALGLCLLSKYTAIFLSSVDIAMACFRPLSPPVAHEKRALPSSTYRRAVLHPGDSLERRARLGFLWLPSE